MITLELVKLHLRVDGDDEDDLIRLYYEAAVSDCAAYLNRPLYQDEAAASEAAKAGKADGVVLNSS
ncbi:MAG: phage gp6-like head-tail connector protein, partial [Neisseria sp.]